MGNLDIDWLKTISGALAAVASAVLLSTLGAAGTLLGAAVGSVAFTVTSAVVAKGLVSSKESLAKAQANALQKVGVAQAEVHRAGRVDDTEARQSHLAHAEDRLDQANRALDRAVAGERLARLPWRRIALLSGALFVAAVLIVTAFELVAGRPVSSLTGGTSGGGTTIGDVGGSGRGHQDPGHQPTPDPDGTPTPSGSDEPTDVPTDDPLETPPTTTPTPTPEVSETPEPTGTTNPEPTQSASP